MALLPRTVLHRSLGGSLHDSDERAWQETEWFLVRNGGSGLGFRGLGFRDAFVVGNGGMGYWDNFRGP